MFWSFPPLLEALHALQKGTDGAVFGSGAQELCISVGELQVSQLPPAVWTSRKQLPETAKDTFLMTFYSPYISFCKIYFEAPHLHLYSSEIYSPDIKNPPESGLQKSIKRVQQWGVHVSDARQETSCLIFISEDIKKRTFYSEEQNFDVDRLVYLTGSDETK